MADTIESDFIDSFHCLIGITIKEKSKNLQHLLKKTQKLLDTSSGKINLSSLVPRTPLEEIFKITALIYFKCADELLDVLKSENPLAVDQVLKHSSWIIKQACVGLTPEYLATTFFPNISYNTKQKLLNQLSYHLNDVDKGDKYFEVIKEHYGYYLASKLLPCCSSDLIMKCLKLYKTEVTPRQLLLIIKKYPNLTETIFEKLDNQNSKIETGIKYKSVIKYLSKKDVNLFIKIYDKYSPNIELGPKETMSFVKNAAKLNAFTNNKKLYNILKTKQIGKSMGVKDFTDFYFTTFPKQISEVTNNLNYNSKLLGYLRNDSKKLEMFSNTFKQIYGNDFWDYNELKQSVLIEWMSPDERAMWLDTHSKPSGVGEEVWISYYKTEKSIPLLKEKISLSGNAATRSKYIVALLKTCKLNKDNSALLDVLKYVNSKHRNDQSSVIEDFLGMFNELYKINQLSEAHWEEIFQCIQLFCLNKGYYYYNVEILEKCIYCRLTHGKHIKDILEFLAKYHPCNYNICNTNPKFQKRCLIEFEALVPLGYNATNIKSGYVNYMHCVAVYNKANPYDKLVIDMKNEYIEYIKDSLEKDICESSSAALLLILQNSTLAVKEGILELLFKQNYAEYDKKASLRWIFKEYPLLLLDHLKNIVKANQIGHSIFKLCKKYSHLGIPEEICKICHELIDDNDQKDRSKIKSAVAGLSILSTSQEYLDFAASYYPTELSLNLENEDDEIMFIKQQAIASYFKHVIPISETLNGLLKFCKGDYLKFAQKSVAVAANNVIENKLYAFFKILKENAVSVRKHAIFLASRVLNRSHASQLLLGFHLKEKNSSLRKVLFKTMFCSFLNDPNDKTFDLIKQFMEEVDVSDAEAFDILTTCRQVPLEFFGKYLEFSWNILEKCSSPTEIIENAQLRLISILNPSNIAAVSDEFYINLLQKNLFKCKRLTSLQKGIHSFTCKYLIYGPGDEEKRLQMVFTIFKANKDQSWNDVSARALTYKLMYNFLKEFCNYISDKKCTNRTIFKQFLSKSEDFLQPHETFDEFVLLQLTLIYLNAVDRKMNVKEIGKEIASLCELLHTKNCLAVGYFATLLREFLKKVYALEFIDESDENEIIFIESLIGDESNSVCLELALDLLSKNIPETPVIKQKYVRILDRISKTPDHAVQMTYHRFLRLIITPED